MAALSSELRAQTVAAEDAAQVETYASDGGSESDSEADSADASADEAAGTSAAEGQEEGDAAEVGDDAEEGQDDDDDQLGIDSGEEDDDDAGDSDAAVAEAGRGGTAVRCSSDPHVLHLLSCVGKHAQRAAARLQADEAEVGVSGRHADTLAAVSTPDEAIRAPGGSLGSDGSDADVCATLFRGMVIWLSREVPREVLMLLVRAFGGTACWDGPASPFAEGDEAITHAVVDRPAQAHVRLGRVYVQPQWVFDSANFRVLVPAAEYAPGRKPPPHLSPFLDYAEEGYVPDYAQKLLSLQEASAAVRQRAAGQEMAGSLQVFDGDDDDAAAAAAATAAKARTEAAAAQFHQELATELGTPFWLLSEGGGVCSADGHSTLQPWCVRSSNQQLFVAQGMTQGAGAGGDAAVARPPKRQLHAPDEELVDSQKKALMPRKHRKMYEGLRRKQEEKAARVATLQRKRDAAAA